MCVYIYICVTHTHIYRERSILYSKGMHIYIFNGILVELTLYSVKGLAYFSDTSGRYVWH